MRRHWRWIVWCLLWLAPLPFMPNVSSLYWLTVAALTGYAFRFALILEPDPPHISDADLWALIERG